MSETEASAATGARGRNVVNPPRGGDLHPQPDPFDRMLFAQAEAERAMFLTAGRALLSLGQANVRDASA